MHQSYRAKMESVTHNFLKDLEAYPGWQEWQKEKIRYVVRTHPDFPEYDKNINDFEFVEPIRQKHQVILQYIRVIRATDALAETEYYFRRFPFNGLPVSRSSHIVNICEMYFSRFYQLYERLKEYLKSLNTLTDKKLVNVGGALKQIKRNFDHEIRRRNYITHHETFSSAEIDLLSLYEFQLEKSAPTVAAETRFLYRKITRDWALRVQRRMKDVEPIIEGVSKATLEIGNFDILKDINELNV